jgi:hypothetical protein
LDRATRKLSQVGRRGLLRHGVGSIPHTGRSGYVATRAIRAALSAR